MKKAPEIITRLIEDESFRQWVLKSNLPARNYWEDWIAQHPEHREDVEIAAEIIRGIRFSCKDLSEPEIDSAWKGLQHKTGLYNSRGNSWLLAASLAGLVIVALAAWFLLAEPPKEVVYNTPFGKTGSWQLPDGSTLTLNANSTVTYRMREEPEPVREILLDGEAYFEVVHLKRESIVPFVVKTPDLAIRVLGTEFNVNTRRGRTRVVLDAGKVQLQLPVETTAMTMKPGELVEYVSRENEIRKENVDTEIFTSWRKNLMKFDDTPLSKVALLIEDNYGVNVTFEAPDLKEIRVTGEVSDENLETLLLALSKLFGLDVEHANNVVHLKRQHKP